MMRRLALLSVLLTAMFGGGCSTTPSNQTGKELLQPVSNIPASVAEQGTLANAVLISDTKAGLASVLNRDLSEVEIAQFVIQRPVGPVGSRAWREVWVLDPGGESRSFIITFSEAGLGAADFEIAEME